MSLVKDMFRVGPAPTLGREATLFAVGLIALGVVALYATSGELNINLLIICGVLALYLVGRLVYRILKPGRTQSNTKR